MLENIDEFEIVPQYKVRDTTFDVMAAGHAESVAKILQNNSDWSICSNPYRVYTGPNLDVLAGIVGDKAAFDASGKRIGDIAHEEAGYRSLGSSITFRQQDMAPLVGEQLGIAGKIMKIPGLGYIDYNDLTEKSVRLHYRFKGDGSAGFEMIRSSGLSNRFHFIVHDPKVNRLLMLTCFIWLQEFSSISPKKLLTESVSLFDPKTYRRNKKPRR